MKNTTVPSLFKLLLLSLIVFFSNLDNIVAQNKASELDKLMKQANASGVFNGSILVAENGKVIYRKAFGYANIPWFWSREGY